MIGVRSLEKEYHVGDHVVRALRGVTLDIAGGEFVTVNKAQWSTAETRNMRPSRLLAWRDPDYAANGQDVAVSTSRTHTL